MNEFSFHKFLPGIAWFFVVMMLTLMPGEDLPGSRILELIYFDKWVHAGIFGLMAIIFIRPFAMSSLPAPFKLRWYLRIAVAVSLWGLAIEFMQKYLVSGRSFDIWDFVADSFGCAIAYFFSKRYMLYRSP